MTTELKSGAMFVAGWRPSVGWVCVMGLAYEFVVSKLLGWISLNAGWQVPPPVDLVSLTAIVVPLLGLGTLRTWEKTKGVEANSLQTQPSGTKE